LEEFSIEIQTALDDMNASGASDAGAAILGAEHKSTIRAPWIPEPPPE
jgi:hypothetical protein